MINELYFFLIMLMSLGIMTTAALIGRGWIYVIYASFYILSNMVEGKMTGFFGLTTTAGTAIFPALFLGTDILSELYGKKSARKAIWFGLAANVTFILIGRAILLLESGSTEYAAALQLIFDTVPRILLASLTAFIISQNLDVTIFHRIKEWSGEKHLWLRNLTSTTVAQLVDTVIFVTLAFGMIDDWPELVITIWGIKCLVALLDTPFIYGVKAIYLRFPQLHRHGGN
jgi:hypothetical protein